MPVGTLHQYTNDLVAFEFGNTVSDDYLIFVGGLTDGLLTVPYLPLLDSKIKPLGWNLVQILMKSSYIGFGTQSLARDCADIGALVKYLRDKKAKKIVVCGHSTGCQDVMQYITKYLPKVDFAKEFDINGGILQAPGSDREALVSSILCSEAKLEELNNEVKQLVEQNGGDSKFLLPSKFAKIWFYTPITAYRWLSLGAKGGDDDYFSSDLTTQDFERTFGKVNKPLLMVHSGNDEFVPDFVDKEATLRKYESFMNEKYVSKYSGVVEGATHNIGANSSDGAVHDFLSRVEGFLKEVGGV